MTIDLRGFDYPLEPVRCRWQWQLDSLHARLGKLEEAVRDAQDTLERLRSRHAALGEEAGQALIRRPDPGHHSRCLKWLTQLRGEICAGEIQLKQLKEDRDSIRRQCRRQRQKIDLIEAHRDECVAAFAGDEARRLAAEADRDWLARPAVARPWPKISSQNGSLATEVQK